MTTNYSEKDSIIEDNNVSKFCFEKNRGRDSYYVQVNLIEYLAEQETVERAKEKAQQRGLKLANTSRI